MISALVPWFGSNRLLAQHVGQRFVNCTWIGIPFAGSLAEVLYLDARTILVNDLHRQIINLARIVAHPIQGPKLYRKLRRTIFHPGQLAESQNQVEKQQDDLEAAYHYFITAWMGRSSQAGTDDEFQGQLALRYSATGGDSAVRFQNATRSLVQWRRVLQRCTFSTLDAFEFLNKCKDREGHGIYCDPPWPNDGDPYRHKFKQHKRLAKRLGNYRKAKVVIRYGDHPLIRELYPETKWTWHRLEGRTQNGRAKAEVLIENRKAA